MNYREQRNPENRRNDIKESRESLVDEKTSWARFGKDPNHIWGFKRSYSARTPPSRRRLGQATERSTATQAQTQVQDAQSSFFVYSELQFKVCWITRLRVYMRTSKGGLKGGMKKSPTQVNPT